MKRAEPIMTATGAETMIGTETIGDTVEEGIDEKDLVFWQRFSN